MSLIPEKSISARVGCSFTVYIVLIKIIEEMISACVCHKRGGFFLLRRQMQ
jgi:hypothetical protein